MSDGARPGWAAELRRAVTIGAAGGVLLGTVEGFSTFANNAFADAQNHAFAYVLVPIALWFVLGPVLLTPVALIAHAVAGAGVPAYAAFLAGIGTLLACLPALEDALGQMRAMGADPSVPLQVALALLMLAPAIAVAVATRAAVAWQLQIGARSLRRAAVGAVLIGVGATAWSGWFLIESLTPPGASVSAGTTAGPPPAGAPNVVLISIDTLRADVLGAYGARPGATPALDRLAGDGVTFEHAVSPAPWTLPALASILTGLYPRHHGAGAIVNRHDPLSRSPLAPGVPTLAEAFAARGYRTHAIVTNPYLLTRSGLAAGYQGYENLTFLSEAMLTGRRNAAQWLLDHIAPRLVVGDRGIEVSDHAVRWLTGVDQSRPFFLWLHYIDPHGPYGNPDDTRHKSFRGETSFGVASATESKAARRSPDPVRLRSGEVRLNDDEKAALHALYADEVTEVDRQVGRVLDALDARGLGEGTLVVMVSDHGEEFWEHGGVEHGHTLYDELLHVPLIMRWPGRLPAGHRVAPMVSTVDVAPTLRDLTGIGGAAPTDGVSLQPLIAGEPAPSRLVLSENMLFAEDRVGIRTDRAKLVRWANGKEEAYDLTNDPAERRDLAGVESFVAPLRAALDDLERTTSPTVTAVAAPPLPAAALRALGYVH